MDTAEKRYSQFGISWAPPAKLFAPVWTVLYVLMAVSFGYLIYQSCAGNVGWMVLVPLILNIIFNLLYYPLQFWVKSNVLATIDILLVLATLIWLIIAILVVYPQYAWTAYINLPYLAWVMFATVLQLAITFK